MAERYRFSLKSEELRGAGQPNILYIMLEDDADAALMKTNLEVLFAADVVTIDKVLARDYSQPYPAGSSRVLRGAMWDDSFHEAQMMLYNVSAATNEKTLAAALIAAGLKMPTGTDNDVVSLNFYDITPPVSF